jgi:predicted phage tail protein
MAEDRAHKDNGAGHVIGGILIIIGGFWSIAQGDSTPDAGIMIIIGIALIAFGIAMSLFGIVRLLSAQSKQ